MNGQNGKFYPNRFITRGEALKTVIRASGRPINTSAEQLYDDVTPGNDFFQYVQSIYIGNDFSADKRFRPDDDLTRGEAAKFIMSLFNFPYVEYRNIFADVQTSTSMYVWSNERYIQAAYDEGVLNGYPDGTYRPDEPIIRAHFAKILSNAMRKAQSIHRYEFGYKGLNVPSGTLSPGDTSSQVAISSEHLPILNPKSGYLYRIVADRMHQAVIPATLIERLSSDLFYVDRNGTMRDGDNRKRMNIFTFSEPVMNNDLFSIEIVPVDLGCDPEMLSGRCGRYL